MFVTCFCTLVAVRESSGTAAEGLTGQRTCRWRIDRVTLIFIRIFSPWMLIVCCRVSAGSGGPWPVNAPSPRVRVALFFVCVLQEVVAPDSRAQWRGTQTRRGLPAPLGVQRSPSRSRLGPWPTGLITGAAGAGVARPSAVWLGTRT